MVSALQDDSMADEFFSLNLHRLHVHVGKPILDLRDLLSTDLLGGSVACTMLVI